MVRLLTRVQAQVRLQVPFLVERLAAVLERTYEVSHPIVLLQVNLEALLATVGLVAALYRTHEVLLDLVGLCMVAQVPLRHERLRASFKVALERPMVF